MNDKPVIPSSAPALPEQRPDSQWVMVFRLSMKSGDEKVEKTYKVNKKRIVVGSALSSDIRINQNSVSNVHAVVEIDDKGNAEIFDMASETGLFVNDKKVVSANLKDGDKLKIGFATLDFSKIAVTEASKSAPADTVRTTGSGRKLFYDTKEDFRPLILEDERNVIQIFDYPSSSEQCLQVVMYWGSVILDVEHIIDLKPVTLGEGKKAAFTVPGLHNEHELVTFEGPSANLQFTGEMSGVVRTGGKVVPISELNPKRFSLKKDDLAKIQFREITFFVSYSPVPPHLRRQRVLERDPLWMQVFFSSLALTAAMILLLVMVTPKKPLDTEEVPPQVATIIFKPPPPKPPEPVVKKVEEKKPDEKKPEEKPKPKPVEVKKPKPVPPKKDTPKPKVIPPAPPVHVKTTPTPKPVEPRNEIKGATPKPKGGNEGEGAKAKGPEGKTGEPNKPKNPVPQKAAKGNPNSNSHTKSQVQGPGNVEAMFSDLGGNIAKSMAAGAAGANMAAKNLQGHGGYTSEGNGGLGLVGDGKGGGGNSNNSMGLSDKGLGDGLKGKGIGRAGSGGDLTGTGYGRPNIEVGNASETVIMGGLDKSVIDEYIRRHMPQLRACYERQLNSSTARLAGRIATRFEISGSGRVTKAGVTSSSINNSKVESCVIGVLRNIVFPEPLGGGVVEVDYPFSFTPAVGG